MRLDSDLANAIGGVYFDSGTIRSLAELGIDTGEDGKLTFDKSKFQSAYASNSADVTEFFTDETRGIAGKVDTVLESLVGRDNSVLVTQMIPLQRQVDNYSTDINNWNTRLATIQDRLLNQFYQMDSIVATIENNLSVISQISYISANGSSSSTSSD